jgi:hypothetical protein
MPKALSAIKTNGVTIKAASAKPKPKATAKARVKAKPKAAKVAPTALVKRRVKASTPTPTPAKVKATRASPRTPKAAPAATAIKASKVKFTKASLVTHLADTTGVDAKDIRKIMGALNAAAFAAVAPRGVGEFTIPGLLKIVARKVPSRKITAIKAGTLKANPFNGGAMEPHKGRAASVKPATVKPKVRALSALKTAMSPA